MNSIYQELQNYAKPIDPLNADHTRQLRHAHQFGGHKVHV